MLLQSGSVPFSGATFEAHLVSLSFRVLVYSGVKCPV